MNEESLTTIYEMIRLIGDNPAREGVAQTPKRVVKSWETIYGGYRQKAEDVLTAQFNSENYDEMVVLKNIEFFSTCEHHMLPFNGRCHVAYIPEGKVLGLSKIARIVDMFARRLQIQERLTHQIADAITEITGCKGCAVVVEAQHMCMVMRGVQKQNSVMKTSSMVGAFRNNPSTRAEFLALLKS